MANSLGQFFTERDIDIRLDDTSVGDHCDDVTIYVDREAYEGAAFPTPHTGTPSLTVAPAPLRTRHRAEGLRWLPI